MAISLNSVLVAQPHPTPEVDTPWLNELALRGLDRMFNREEGLFCFRLRKVRGELVHEGLSRRYTLMCLLGLNKAERAGHRTFIPVRQTSARLLEESRKIDNIGDLGLLLWLLAHTIPNQLAIRCFDMDLQGALERYQDARDARTMELAWFLSGLAECELAGVSVTGGQEKLATRVWEMLRANWGERGYFVQMGKGKGLAGLVRGRIGSFADQVYPIYALSRFYQAYGHQEALQLATVCATAICRAQGPLGQWWWHYDASEGSVIGKYPVYSVHQHGMAPMALQALSNAGPCDFTPEIQRGLQWVGGKNELRFDMRSESEELIWRSIYRNRNKRIFSEALNLLSSSRRGAQPGDLAIKWECCPYELGWLLFALSGTKNANA